MEKIWQNMANRYAEIQMEKSNGRFKKDVQMNHAPCNYTIEALEKIDTFMQITVSTHFIRNTLIRPILS